jgi:hypothetical protein
MARRQPDLPDPPGTLPSVQPEGRPQSHHLASVVHHFLSDDVAEPVVPYDLPALGAVAGHGTGAGVPRVAWLLGEAGDMFTWHDLGLPGPDELGRLEAGADVVRGLSDCRGAWTALVWCLDESNSGSLAAACTLGRLVNALRPAAVEIVVMVGPDRAARGEGTLPADSLDRCRKLAAQVAPGIPTRTTASTSIRLKQILSGFPERLEPLRKAR